MGSAAVPKPIGTSCQEETPRGGSAWGRRQAVPTAGAGAAFPPLCLLSKPGRLGVAEAVERFRSL